MFLCMCVYTTNTSIFTNYSFLLKYCGIIFAKLAHHAGCWFSSYICCMLYIKCFSSPFNRYSCKWLIELIPSYLVWMIHFCSSLCNSLLTTKVIGSFIIIGI